MRDRRWERPIVPFPTSVFSSSTGLTVVSATLHYNIVSDFAEPSESVLSEVRLFTTLDDLSFSFTDRHGIDPNEGEPSELHRHQSPQFHLTWETGVSSRRRRFLGVMTVNGAEALIKKTGTCVRVTYEDQSLEVQLDPGTISFG